jgi:hypothetical protein
VNPVYQFVSTVGPIDIIPAFAWILANPPDVAPLKVSPVKLMAPLPVATTLAPTWSTVTVKAWTGWTEQSDVTAIAKNISGRSFLGEVSMPGYDSIRHAKVD